MSDSPNHPIGTATEDVDALGTIAPSRNRLTITRPVMAESAPVITALEHHGLATRVAALIPRVTVKQ